MKTRLKFIIGIGYILILTMVLSFLNFWTILSILPVVFWVSFLVFFFTFGERETISVLGSVFLFFLIIWIIFVWISQTPLLPGINFKLTDQNVIALFTIVLASATIINIFIYNKSISMSRLSVLDFFMFNNSLSISVKNLGDFPARSVKMEVEVTEKNPKKLFQKWNDFINTSEQSIHYLPPKDSKILDFSNFLSERLDIDEGTNESGERNLFVKDKHINKEYTIRFILSYHTDHLFKSPIPITKKYLVHIKDGEARIIDPDDKQ